ncbi:cysteine proteinase [Calocera viscosa TUFC12733]|uniref:Ubiquitin carboxyl-terminal hydrolase n=1 Tax=Calocera viscosa (strain TUFC12733) TaxID=1330018 RepID=A0A167H043_CALVF|nr:cysteine proteinase [Calocera viscosa TUFC12733]
MATTDAHPDDGYRAKYFIPLESDPDVFTQLIHNLGVSKTLSFVDVLSLTDPNLLAFIPRPVLALILVFPDFGDYAAGYAKEQAGKPEYEGSGPGEDAVWFKQTIGNACGLYALLHAVCNGKARDHVDANSPMARLLTEITPLSVGPRAHALESSTELEDAHRAAALQGQTVAPPAEDHVEHHYICFVRSHKNGHLYQMDGMLKGPVDLGEAGGEDDLMGERTLQVVRKFVETGEQGNVGFSLMALVEDPN